MLVRVWRKRHPRALSTGMQIRAATAESCREVPKKIKNKPTLGPRNPILSIYLNEIKQGSLSYLHLHIHRSIIHSSQHMEAASVYS